jgi:hypothetical protein
MALLWPTSNSALNYKIAISITLSRRPNQINCRQTRRIMCQICIYPCPSNRFQARFAGRFIPFGITVRWWLQSCGCGNVRLFEINLFSPDERARRKVKGTRNRTFPMDWFACASRDENFDVSPMFPRIMERLNAVWHRLRFEFLERSALALIPRADERLSRFWNI